jgi:hypothetical protein
MQNPMNKRLFIEVTQADIELAAQKRAMDCMIYRAVQRVIGLGKYIHVDASGVSITRHKLYREKADLPRLALVKLRDFDMPGGKDRVTPFSFWLRFRRTTNIMPPRTREQKDTINFRRIWLKHTGNYKKYDPRNRVSGADLSPVRTSV